METGAEPAAARARPADWGRQDWERLADRTLAAALQYATENHALIHLPGPVSRSGRWSDGLEGYARTFLLAGFRLSRSGEHDPGAIAERYAAGLAAGTDPSSPDRWPAIDDVPQAKVECASIALALHESRPWIWDRLDDRVRGNVVDWMSAMLGTRTPDNNWTWFRAVTNAFLRSVGGPWRQEDIDHTLERTEAWYVGDGWYSDGEPAPGRPRNFDYYSGWAMQFYPLWYCRISGDQAEPGLLDRYRERLRRYLHDAERLIGVNGRPLIQGRSLTYRFAMLAPFWTGAIFDATPLTPGRTRRLTGAVINHFLAAGSYDDADLLPIGWHGAFEAMRETYSGSGSPYWASKGFAGLVLPEDHPVWTAPEEPLPIEAGDVSFALPKLGWIVSGTREDGIVRMVQHGGDHTSPDRLSIDVPGYARHAYSTHAAPEYAWWNPVDSHVALITPDGRASHRSPALPLDVETQSTETAGTETQGAEAAGTETFSVAAGRGISRHRAHWWQRTGPIPNDVHRQDEDDRFEVGPWLTTASLLHGPWEVRLARIDRGGAAGSGDASERQGSGSGTAGEPGESGTSGELGGQWPANPGPWKLRFGGWALALDESIRPQVAGGAAWAIRPDRLSTTIVALRGDFSAGCTVSQGTNPLGIFSAIPQVETTEPVVPGRLYAALVVLSGTMAGPEAARGVTLDVRGGDEVGAGSALVTVTWPDGRRDELDFPFPAAPNGGRGAHRTATD